MRISQERKSDLYNSFSEPIMKLRVSVKRGLPIEQVDQRLFDLEIEISKRIDKALNVNSV